MTNAGTGRRSVAAILLATATVAGTATAHEEYVVEETRDETLAEFYGSALSDPLVVGPLVAAAIAVLVAVLGFTRYRPFRADFVAFRDAMDEYRPYVPWLLRISVGIPLVGAGFAGYFLSPAVEVELRILQVALGFLLLFGLATRVVAATTLAIYLVGVVVQPALLLQLELVGGLVAIGLVGSGRPSADHVLQRIAGTPGTAYRRIDVVHGVAQAFQDRVDPYRRLLPTVIRLGLGTAFVFLGTTQKLLQPGLALGVVDRYDLTAAVPVPAELWVLGSGLAEVSLGLALLVGLYTRGVATAALCVFTLTLFALPDDPVLAHVCLFGLASVLLITGGGPYSIDGVINRDDASSVSSGATGPTVESG